MKWKRVRIVSMAGVLLVLAVLACGPGSETSMPSIAINSPGSGSKVAVGEEVSIDSTAVGGAGVARVELSVNGVLVGRSMPPSGNPTTFRVVQWWTPTEERLVTVSVVAFDVNGASSDSATIALQVVASAGEVPTAAPTDGPGTVVPPGPTDTPLPPVTTEGGCTADSQYVADVTIPDGTVMSPGQTFVKTWRVRNAGTCDWTAGHELVFVSGAHMGGPGAVALPATPAGSETDVSVSLTAPNAYGTHKGTWRMRASDGTMFGVNLSVLITVPAPVTDTPEPLTPTDTPIPPTATDTPTPTPTDEPTHKEITLSPSSVGSVVEQIGVGSGCYVGDTALNLGQQCFVTFDVSTIPDSATIERAELQFSSVTKTGDPFGSLSDLNVYHHNYGDLDIGDWKVMGNMNDAIDTLHQESDFDHPRVLNTRGETGLQDSLASDRFQIRFHFVFSDGDGDSEIDTVNITGIQLKARYRP
jgi:hypothetical protein